ncbi:MAG: DNA polymerase III subunit gamma/tau [Erysipelotrichaceae bacterium]|nr:DNA polymerase III subunit gamma/tau [Erysipelotrichaceae bacterium]MDY5252560.1 DNA polymerase III subunit gamma/tau [Erysipelotrichaceae bacterium]
MGYKALYRTYRPRTFDDVVGQQHIVKTLQNAVKENKLAHAYLFCGPRGTGKTSIAKILAKTINCENSDQAPCENCRSCIDANENQHQDIFEIDAASNNGVDEIRNLIDKVKYAPMEGKYKVYIIDEVHMLSQGAFNALLKTLEEPPAHVIFILATTEPQKVLPTIISRCQRYNFEKVSEDDLAKRLSYVCEKEGINATPESLHMIAKLADGGVRDSLSMLDQFVAYNHEMITVDDINEVYGLTTIDQKIKILLDIVEKKAKDLIISIEEMDAKGIDIGRLTNSLIDILKESVVYTYSQDAKLLSNLTADQVLSLTKVIASRHALKMIDILMESSNAYRNTNHASKYFEVACLKMMEVFNEETLVETKVIKKELPKATIQVDIQPPLVQNEVKNEPVESKIDLSVKEYDEEFLLGLLVKCDKVNKNNDMQSFAKLSQMMDDLENLRYIRPLMDSKICASGEDCIILGVKMDAIANMLNDEKMNKELYNFIYTKLNINKMIYALSNEKFVHLVEVFKQRSKEKTLPPSSIVEFYDLAQAKHEETNEEKLVNLFGDMIDIVKE